jgi:hypothetical protein
MAEIFRNNELIAVQSDLELRFSHYKIVDDEQIAWAYIIDTSKKPPRKFDPSPLLSVLVREDWKKPSTSDKSAESVIIKAGRNAIDIALDKLDKIPMVDDDHIAVPWPITERPKLDPEVWEESEIKSVTIADLYASQKLLTKERVVFFIENPGAIELGRRAFANVYDLGERLVIVDGHHRLAALWLLGADEANVWFLEE